MWCIPPKLADEDTLSRYSFVEDDYPAYYPLDTQREVVMTAEDTVHYQVSSPEADSEWASMFPPGGGFLRLGTQGGHFVFSLHHQLHCLDRIRQAIREEHSTPHVHHCFNYLRQLVLCEASSTLEPVVPNAGPHAAYEYSPAQRTCVDWSRVYAVAAANFESTSGKFQGRSDI